MRRLFLLFLLLFAGCDNKKQELHLFGWPEIVDQASIRKFEEKYNCRVLIDSYDSNETMYAKIRSGGVGYDIIMPSQYFVEILQKQGLIRKIDYERLPNLQDLDTAALTHLDPEFQKYAVPFDISFTGLGYRADKVKDFQPSWQIFQRSNLRKRMTLLNDYREVIGVALITLGYSVNSVDPDEIDQAAHLVLEWKKNIAKFENDQYKNGIATAEFLVIQGISADVLQVSAENSHVEFAIPEEGSIINYNTLAIPTTAQNPDLAYAFINFVYEPEITASIIERTFQLVPNKNAYPIVRKDILQKNSIYPPPEMWKKLQPIRDLGEGARLYHNAWERIKGSTV